MTEPAAFMATYTDWKLVRTRSVVQVVFEIPVENGNAVLKVLGGMPDGTHWFGIAPLKNPPAEKEIEPTAAPAKLLPDTDKRPAGAKRDWKDLQPSQQAGIRCEDPVFIAFLRETRNEQWREIEDAAEMVRLICVVNSRSQLNTSHPSRVMWHLLDEEFQAWKALEHA